MGHFIVYKILDIFLNLSVTRLKIPFYLDLKVLELKYVLNGHTITNILFFVEIAESFGGDDLEDVVIATPYSFSDQQKMTITYGLYYLFSY